MIIQSKCKNSDDILAYTYMLYFNVNDKLIYYYGVRYGNVRLGIAPIDDIFKLYFSSSKSVHNLLNDGKNPIKIIIHKTFTDVKEACKFEVMFLSKLNAKNRKDFLNQTNTFDNSLPNNSGRIITNETKLKIGIASKKNQSSYDYKLYRSNMMKERWNDPIFIEKMKLANSSYKDSGKSKLAGTKSGNSRIGLTYSDEIKSKRSAVMKNVCKSIDMKARALNRKKYECPICNLSNLDGGNFNNHMKAKHDWSSDECSTFKFKV